MNVLMKNLLQTKTLFRNRIHLDVYQSNHSQQILKNKVSIRCFENYANEVKDSNHVSLIVNQCER